jgi:hypothetical protein
LVVAPGTTGFVEKCCGNSKETGVHLGSNVLVDALHVER